MRGRSRRARHAARRERSKHVCSEKRVAGWRARVPHTLPLAIWGLMLCLWIYAPIEVHLHQVEVFRNFVSILGWVWLVRAWGRLVLNEWPAPIWSHWIVGTLLLLLPLTGAVVLIRAL